MKPPGTYAERQVVLDAAAELQLGRSVFIDALAGGGHGASVRVLARGPEMTDQIIEESRRWKHLLSVRQTTSAQQLRVSLPNNRSCLAGGLKMTSLFDWYGTDPAARTLLRRERPGVYHFVWAPVNLKIIDMTEVLLQGPDENGHSTVMAVSNHGILAAAMKYWNAVLVTAVPAWADPDQGTEQFTARQRWILDLLSQDHTDQSIADLLGVSLRTVRYDVAEILETLGVGTRFAAGLRLGADHDDSAT